MKINMSALLGVLKHGRDFAYKIIRKNSVCGKKYGKNDYAEISG